jgi:hypothetical protein
MYIVKKVDDEIFPFLAIDESGNYHKYTAKGRYFHGFGNHPLHLRQEVRDDYKKIFYAMNGKR